MAAKDELAGARTYRDYQRTMYASLLRRFEEKHPAVVARKQALDRAEQRLAQLMKEDS